MSRARAGAIGRGAAAGGSTGGGRAAHGRAGAAARRSGGNGGRAGGVRSGGVRGADPCPCGGGRTYAQCCEPLHDGAPAPTAQALMRSRYTAFVVGDEDYLFRTWHPRTRPEGPYCHPGTRWTGLTIHETVDGGADDETGIVEFTATYRSGDGRGGVVEDALRERSRFTRRAGRWLYLDAVG